MNLPQYLLESSLCLAVFAGCYWWLFRSKTYFLLNRLYLLISPILSFIIPAIHIELEREELRDQGWLGMESWLDQVNAVQTQVYQPLYQPAPSVSLSLGELLMGIYLLGVLILAWCLGSRLWRIAQLIRTSRKEQMKEYTLVETKANFPAASFFGFLFWNRQQAPNAMILEHELAHIRQKHSLDVLLIECCIILQWFNPLMALYRLYIREVHEYLADDYVVRRYGSAYRYAQLLARQWQTSHPTQMLHTFASLLKKRLLMMNKIPSTKVGALRYAFSIPVFAGLSLLFSFNLSQKTVFGKTIEQADGWWQNVAQTTVWSVEEQDYHLSWEDKVCDCFESQARGYFQCENFSISARDFRKLTKRSEGFRLIKEGVEVPYQKLRINSKEDVKIQGTHMNIQDLGDFDPKAAIWNKLGKGDVVKFTFETGDQQVFQFEVTIQKGRAPADFSYDLYLGEVRIPIDMTTGLGHLWVDEEGFKALPLGEVRLVANQSQTIDYQSIEINLRGGLLEPAVYSYEKKGILQVPIQDWASNVFEKAGPGARVNISLLLQDSKKVMASIHLKREGNTDGLFPDHSVYWGGRELKGTRIDLTKEQWLNLAEQVPKVFINGQKQEITEWKIGQDWVRFEPQEFRVKMIEAEPEEPGGFSMSLQLRTANHFSPQYFVRLVDEELLEQEMATLASFRDLTSKEEDPPELWLVVNNIIVGPYNSSQAQRAIAGLTEQLVVSVNAWPTSKAAELFGENMKGGVLEIKTKAKERPKVVFSATDSVVVRSGEVTITHFALPETSGYNSEKKAKGLPLFVINGTPLHTRKVEIESILEPENIERIEVYRGEKAEEKYGAAGANGVVEIYSKKPVDLTQWAPDKPLVLIDGELVDPDTEGELGDWVSPSEIDHIKVYKGEKAKEKHPAAGKAGLIEIITKNGIGAAQLKQKEHQPTTEASTKVLIVVNGTVLGQVSLAGATSAGFTGNASIRNLVPEEALAKYGIAGKNGAIEVITNF